MSQRGVLIVLTGEARDRRIPLVEGQPIVVGRSQQATVTIDDKALSRQHFHVLVVGKRCFVEDLGSLNGTYVNGVRVAGVNPLQSGDELQVGGHRFAIELASEEELEPISMAPPDPERTAVTELGFKIKSIFCTSCDEPIDPRLISNSQDTLRPFCSICAYIAATSDSERFDELLDRVERGESSGATSGSDNLRASRTDDELPDAAPSARVGPFLLYKRIGSGGFGAVHKAWDERARRWAVVKLLDPLLSERQVLKRFLLEARIIAKLNHPGIVRCIDLGHADKILYLAMEFRQGTDLERLIEERGPQPERTVARWGIQICNALDYAHQNGVIHRDLSLNNLILDDNDTVQVIDFGLSRALEDSKTGLSTGGQLIGTPHYMAPEQIHSPGQAGRRSDIYALGVVLFRLASGAFPHAGHSKLTGFLRAKLEDAPLRLRAVKPDASAELEQVIDRAMAYDPTARYKSSLELAGDLRGIFRRGV